MPISAASRCFMATYLALGPSSPTSSVPSPGVTPCSASAAMRVTRSALISAATASPSITIAVTSGSPGWANRGNHGGRVVGLASALPSNVVWRRETHESVVFSTPNPPEPDAHQWRKWRSPVRTMARPCSSAAATTSSSRIDPPGWMTTVAPASTAPSRPSGKGKKASEA